MTEPREYHWSDTTLCVRAPGTGQATTTGPNGRRIPLAWVRPDWQVWTHLLRALLRAGFTIEDDPRIAQHYPSLRATHRYGRRSDLEWVGHTSPMGCQIEFFQNVVTENRNGGRYDFNRLAKMPINIRRHFTLARRALEAALAEIEIPARPECPSPNPDPLAYFNHRWDGDGDRRRGEHRFARGPDGWPTDKEIGQSNRRDAGGVELTHGAIRYARDHRGYLQRGRVYGGINGMWLMVYGPGARDFTHHQAQSLFTWRPGLARKAHPRAKVVLERHLKEAVKAENYERAIMLRNALQPLRTPPAPPQEQAA